MSLACVASASAQARRSIVRSSKSEDQLSGYEEVRQDSEVSEIMILSFMLPAVTVERNWSPPPASPCWRARWGQGLAPNVNSFLVLVLRTSLLFPYLKGPNVHFLSSKQMRKCLAIRRDLFGHWFAPWAYGCRNSHCTSSKVECKTLVSRWSHWIWVRLPVQSTSSLARFSCLNPIPSSTLGFVLCCCYVLSNSLLHLCVC